MKSLTIDAGDACWSGNCPWTNYPSSTPNMDIHLKRSTSYYTWLNSWAISRLVSRSSEDGSYLYSDVYLSFLLGNFGPLPGVQSLMLSFLCRWDFQNEDNRLSIRSPVPAFSAKMFKASMEFLTQSYA